MNTLTIHVRHRCLILPVSGYVSPRKLRLTAGGRTVQELTVRLDYVHPTHRVFCDISAYHGQPLTLSTEPEVCLHDLQTDTPDEDLTQYADFLPYVHFTPPFGWCNDPNGLLRYTSPVTGETVYHMFYQHNPYDWIWGNMTWGHAVSRDLLHWEHRPPAIHPDERGTIFSGSGIVDRENRSGLKSGAEDPILLFYTSAPDAAPFTQCLAYSNDGGRTFEKYGKNPIVPNILGANRDPKVIWCEELNAYVMALYLDQHTYQLLTSGNLLDWTPLQRIELEGDAECPDFYPLNANGDPSRRKWILSGASMHYIVGDIVNGAFRPCQEARMLNYGGIHYAGQSYSGTERRLMMTWQRDTHFGSAPLCGQMSLPYEMQLRYDEGGYWMTAEPAGEIETLYRRTTAREAIALRPGAPLSLPLEESAYELRLLPEEDGESFRIDIFGQELVIDGETHTLRVQEQTLPLSDGRENAEIRMILDKSSLEVFSCGGRALLSVSWMLDFNRRQCVLSSEDGARIRSLTLTELAL